MSDTTDHAAAIWIEVRRYGPYLPDVQRRVIDHANAIAADLAEARRERDAATARAARLRELLLARKEYTFILDETNCPPARLTSEDARTIRRLEAAEKACEVHGDLDDREARS